MSTRRPASAGAAGAAETRQTCAVVPCFNEGDRLESVVGSLLAIGSLVIVVDDGSSPPVSLRPRPGLHLLRHRLNRGQGAALATGFTWARRCPWDVLITFDSDGQHDPVDIPGLIAPVVSGSCDVALGSRFLGTASGISRARRLSLKLARRIEWLRTGILLTDAHNGLRAMNRRAVEVMDLRLDGFAHASEILQIIRDRGLSWCERPVSIRYTAETAGKGQSWMGGVRVLRDLAAGAFFREDRK